MYLTSSAPGYDWQGNLILSGFVRDCPQSTPSAFGANLAGKLEATGQRILFATSQDS
jgi:hypothetical protein